MFNEIRTKAESIKLAHKENMKILDSIDELLDQVDEHIMELNISKEDKRELASGVYAIFSQLEDVLLGDY